MTGAGFAAGVCEFGEVRIEVRTVNGRTLAVRSRVPAALAGHEPALEDLVRSRLQRGMVTVAVEVRAGAPLLPDRAALRAAAAQLQELARELGLPPPSLAEVVQLFGSPGRPEPAAGRPLPPRFAALLEQALLDLEQHRRSEGLATAAAIERELAGFEGHVAAAAARAPQLAGLYRERLLQRVQEFVAAHLAGPVPAVDVVREVALHADRIDTAEELQRLSAHLAELRAALAAGGSGRRLEFLLQELLRETNTLGAKSPDAPMAHLAVAMKTCIDRMKEQAANLE